MSYDVVIRNNATGETVRHAMELPWFDHSIFWWTEGNFHCDCNRGMEFARAKGMTEDEINNMDDDEDEAAFPCGHERYTVIKAIFPDGKEIEIDGSRKTEEPRNG